MQEGRVRYREIAVITGDLPGYGKEITHQFTQNQIPHFLDDKKNVLDNCLVELIRASLEAVRQDFSYESVMRFLRTGLVSQDRTMMDRLENYILAMGIRGGKRFRATWEQTYRGAGDLNITELNAFKERALAPLFAMQETLPTGTSDHCRHDRCRASTAHRLPDRGEAWAAIRSILQGSGSTVWQRNMDRCTVL